MSPSSPVSVGTSPSNRTLEFGYRQVITVFPMFSLEQFPAEDDPFTDLSMGIVKLSGYTVYIN